jgi:hypothetical protein
MPSLRWRLFLNKNQGFPQTSLDSIEFDSTSYMVKSTNYEAHGHVGEIRGSRDNENANDCLMECCAVQSGKRLPTLQRSICCNDGVSKHL